MSDPKRFDLLDEKIDKILDNQVAIKVDLSQMKVDVAHHIKRSDQHDARLQTLERMVWMAAGSVAVIGLLKTIGLF